MKFKGEIQPYKSPTWAAHLIIPDKIAAHFNKAGIKRLVVKINNTVEYPAALMSTGKGGFFVHVNKENRKKLGIDVGDKVEVELVEDKSKYGMPMPDEFQELLYQDPEGDKLFHGLTPGKQRSLLHMIGKPKSVDIKIRKGLIVLEYLKEHGGKVDFPTLNQAFKDGKDMF